MSIKQQLFKAIEECGFARVQVDGIRQLLPSVVCAEIVFSTPQKNFNHLIKHTKRFIFLDKFQMSPSHISCTVYDDSQKLNFGLKGTEEKFVLSPGEKYEPESFVAFFLIVQRLLDKRAKLQQHRP